MQEAGFMTVTEVAAYLRLAEKQDLPGFKAGAKWRFIKSEVDQWLRGRRR